MKIIPKPEKIELLDGKFDLTLKTSVSVFQNNAEFEFLTKYLEENIKKLIGLDLVKNNDVSNHTISFQLKPEVNGPEGYILEVGNQNINIFSEDRAGLFYGIQTLLQLMYQSKNESTSGASLPCCKIEDKPRFKWRGMHLDVSRHFFPVKFIKKYIDLLVLHKMNKFHWHLTDDNGWRIDLKKFPLLTEICAWRKNLEHIPWNEREKSPDPGNGIYGGFYSQLEIVEIVEYAAERFIEVIPEIEMPGHSSEIFAAYPQYSCQGKKLRVAPGGYWPNSDIFCAGKDETFHFLGEILNEVAQLFPSKYIHIGGDEANKTFWKSCPLCQNRIKEENLKDEAELQSYFIGRISEHLGSIGKQLIGWDEILDGDLKTEAVVMCWRGDGVDAARGAATKNLKMVMCPNKTLYFDWKQNEESGGAFGVTTVEQVYNYNPVPENLTVEEKKLVLGAQGNAWTEWMENSEKVEYMVLPRLCALSESVWATEEQKHFPEFKERLSLFLDFLMSYDFVFNSNI